MDPITAFLIVVIILALNVLALRSKIDKLEDKHMADIDRLLSLFEDQSAINHGIENKIKELSKEIDKNGKSN